MCWPMAPSSINASETGLVLVVSDVCVRGYGAGGARVGSATSQERLVGRSAAGAAVGVAEEEVVFLDNRSPYLDTSPPPALRFNLFPS